MSGKSLNDMDAFLSEIGLCRKSITKDHTCLFRAVSEKLFYTQSWHGRLKDSCLEFLARHLSDYQPFVDECLKDRIQHIQDNKIKAGHLEMIVLTRMYRLDFVLFHSPSFHPVSLTQNYYHKQIALCTSEDNHYDIVYTKTHMEAAGICQSIIYEILYKGVFGLDSELEEAVMFLELQKQKPRDDCLSSCSLVDVISLFGSEKVDTFQRVSGLSSPPVPYRIAKALHPALYRNVELDIIQEEKREARLRTLDACKGFSPGDKCQVVLDENERHPYKAHIQVIDELGGSAVVFVEELGVRKTVPVSSIRPLPLHVHRPGDLIPPLPVAEVNVQPYLKKGKRRKQPQVLPLLVSDTKSGTVASIQRGHSSNSSSSSSHNISSSSDGNTNLNSIAGSSSSNFLSSHLASRGSIINSGVDNGSSDRTSCLVPVDASYIYPPNEIGLPGVYYTNPMIDLSNSSNTCNQLLVPGASYTSLSYTPQQGETGQLVTTVDSTQPYYMMSSNSAPNQGPVYWMPMVAVPYGSNMGQVNLGWNPSQDPYGKDLPLSDINTLRYFFNLGVEFYRMSASGQSTSYPPGIMYSPHSGSEMNQSVAVMMDGTGSYTSMAPLVCTETHTNSNGTSTRDRNKNVTYTRSGSDGVNIDSKAGTIFSINQAENYGKKDASGGFDYSNNTKSDKKAESVADKLIKDSNGGHEHVKDGDVGKDIDKDSKTGSNDDVDDDVSEGMDARSDGDSGCPSECADLSPVGGRGSSEISQSEGGELLEQTDSVDNPKPRGKRRYYMYGNHKLVKPIKEIPVRFQILLAETSAAKARCEGQPIYMQQQQPPQQPMYDYVYYPANEGTQPQLNANATCFVPSQDSCVDTNMAPAYLPECYTVSPVPGYPNSMPNMTNQPANAGPLHPTPMFVPALTSGPCVPSHSATSQNCQTIIVYSSHSTSSSASHSSPLSNQQIRSVSMPPPPHYPPPTALPALPLDQMSTNSTPCLSPAVNQVIPRSLPANHSQPPVSYTDHHMKAQNPHSQAVIASKPSVVLSVPPPNHNSTMQGPASHQSPCASHLSPTSMAPPPNSCRFPYNNAVYLPVPQPLASPPNMHAPHINGSSLPAPPSSQQGSPNSSSIVGAPHSVPFPGVSANQYMYIYPSPPTGQSATPPHVVYMVNPAYPPTQNYHQQQGVLVPSSCPVPVQ